MSVSDQDEDEDEDEDEDGDVDEDEDNVGGTHRHRPLRYILGGDEPHPPWVPAPRAAHILLGHVPRYWCCVGSAPGKSSVSVSVSVSADVSV